MPAVPTRPKPATKSLEEAALAIFIQMVARESFPSRTMEHYADKAFDYAEAFVAAAEERRK